MCPGVYDVARAIQNGFIAHSSSWYKGSVLDIKMSQIGLTKKLEDWEMVELNINALVGMLPEGSRDCKVEIDKPKEGPCCMCKARMYLLQDKEV